VKASDYARICYEAYRNYLWISDDKSLIPWQRLNKKERKPFIDRVDLIFKRFATGNRQPVPVAPENQLFEDLTIAILGTFWDLRVEKFNNKIA